MNKNIIAALLISVGILGTGTASADTNVSLKFTQVLSGMSLQKLGIPITSNPWAGNFEVAVKVGSTQTYTETVYCVDPAQWATSSWNTYSKSTTPTVSLAVQSLYNNHYASTLGNATNAATFQTALWELYNDNGNVTTGNVKFSTGLSTTVASISNNAQTWINAAKTDASDGSVATGYTYTLYTNANKQDFLVAHTAPVPEPETYAMLLAGLGLMGGIARRRTKK